MAHNEPVTAQYISGVSDHIPFHEASVPAVCFFTHGIHPYWHTPNDTIDTIDIVSLEQTAQLLTFTTFLLTWDTVYQVSR